MSLVPSLVRMAVCPQGLWLLPTSSLWSYSPPPKRPTSSSVANGAWTAAPSTHHPHTSGDTTLPPLLPSPISTPPLPYLNPSPLLSQPPSPLLSQPLPSPISTPLPSPISTPPLSYLNPSSLLSQPPSPLLSQPLPSPISTPPLSYLNPPPLPYLNPSPRPIPSIYAPSLLRYLSYISRLVAAEKPYKPHSRSVRLRTLRVTCVPLMDKERCVCVSVCAHVRGWGVA